MANVEPNKLDIGLTPMLLKHCELSFIRTGYHISELQKDVVSELSSIGLNTEEEVLLQHGYMLDLIVNISKARLLVSRWMGKTQLIF